MGLGFMYRYVCMSAEQKRYRDYVEGILDKRMT